MTHGYRSHTYCMTTVIHIGTSVPCPDTGSQMDTYMQCGTHTHTHTHIPAASIDTHGRVQTLERTRHRLTQKWPQRNMECFRVQLGSPATATQRYHLMGTWER